VPNNRVWTPRCSSGHHEIRGRGANRWTGFGCHDCYRLCRAADRSADHDCDLSNLAEVKITPVSGRSRPSYHRTAVFPGRPDGARHTIDESHGGDVVTALTLARQGPLPQTVKWTGGALLAMGGHQRRARTVHQQGAQVDVATLGDAAESATLPSWSTPEGSVPARTRSAWSTPQIVRECRSSAGRILVSPRVRLSTQMLTEARWIRLRGDLWGGPWQQLASTGRRENVGLRPLRP